MGATYYGKLILSIEDDINFSVHDQTKHRQITREFHITSLHGKRKVTNETGNLLANKLGKAK